MLHVEFLVFRNIWGEKKRKNPTGREKPLKLEPFIRLPFPFACLQTAWVPLTSMAANHLRPLRDRPATPGFNHGSFTPMKPLVVTFIRTQQDNAGHHSPFTYHISMEQKHLMIPRQFPPIFGNRFQFSIQPTDRNTTCAIFLGR